MSELRSSEYVRSKMTDPSLAMRDIEDADAMEQDEFEPDAIDQLSL